MSVVCLKFVCQSVGRIIVPIHLRCSGECGLFCKFADCASMLRVCNPVCKTLAEGLGTLRSAYIEPLAQHLQICAFTIYSCRSFLSIVSVLCQYSHVPYLIGQ